MKKTIVVTLSVLALAALALAIIPTTRDEIHWRWASHKDETASYESYVKTWPDGRHAADARARYDEHGWADAEAANTVEGFERYVQRHGEGKHVAEAKDNIESLHWQETTGANTVEGFERYVQRHGEGKHVAEAKDNIESLHWQEATAANTIRSYRNHISSHPQGRFAQEAQTKASALRTDNAPYEAALKAEASLKRFLEDFPGHQRESDAQQAMKDITEGRDIVDLLREKKIEIETQGSGIQSVGIRIRKLVPYTITVRVPIGSYFVSSRRSAQNMVTTAERKVRLTGDEWRRVSVSAACANRPRDIPGSGDTFTVQRSPHQAELAKLMPVLDRAGVEYAVRQAAVWIVTDNADYSDLGSLVSRSSYQFYGGTRVIQENDTARAMKILSDAGIHIKGKAIWRDRKLIARELPEGELKSWLADAKPVPRSSVRSAQKKLADLGYKPGPIDGLWGRATENALRSFQRNNGLPQTGKLDSATSKAMGL